MDIKTFVSMTTKIPPHIAVLMRGSTGIGKSAIAASVAKDLGVDLIDVRGSTMTEGDVGGYPDLEGMKDNKVMTFCMPSWFVKACNEPVVLFLDELNRSLPQVQQSFFQIVLDRELGNDVNGKPYRLHKDTRVIAAVNHGAEYDVNEMDPALLRRFWTCDIETDVDSWVSWARNNSVSNVILEFVKSRSSHFSPDPSKIEPGNVFPTPASWTRLNETLSYAGIDLESNSVSKTLVYNIAVGFVGTEAGIEFSDFVEKYESDVKPENVLDSYDRFEAKIAALTNHRVNGLIDRLANHAKDNTWTLTQSENAAKFAKSISEEMLIHMWSAISKTRNIKTIQNFHTYIGDYLVKVVSESKTLNK